MIGSGDASSIVHRSIGDVAAAAADRGVGLEAVLDEEAATEHKADFELKGSCVRQNGHARSPFSASSATTQNGQSAVGQAKMSVERLRATDKLLDPNVSIWNLG